MVAEGQRKHLRSEFSPVECREAAVEGGAGDWGEVVTRYPYRKVRMDHLLSREIRRRKTFRRVSYGQSGFVELSLAMCSITMTAALLGRLTLSRVT